MLNLLKAIGVLLVFGGISCFLIGVLRLLLSSMDSIIPESFKKVFTVQTGALILLAGLILLYL